MKLFTCCLILLPFVAAAPAKARRENILSFLNDAFATATEKALPVTVTAHRSSPSKPVDQLDSEDMSDDTSAEHVSNKDNKEAPGPKPGGDSTDVDSEETQTPKPVVKVKPGKRPAAQAGDGSRDQTDAGSDEAKPDPQRTAKLQSKPKLPRSRQGAAVGPSEEAPDPDSLEVNDGRPGVQDRADPDETREGTSAELAKNAAPRQKRTKTRAAANKRRAKS